MSRGQEELRLRGSLEQEAAAPARAVGSLLEVSGRFDDLALTFQAFREGLRSSGILEESRNGQLVYDQWSKLLALYLQSFLARGAGSLGSARELEGMPPVSETLSSRWQRAAAELEAFLEGTRELDRAIHESEAACAIQQRIRSRLLLLEHQAERVQVACGLIRRDLAFAARRSAERCLELLSGGEA